SSHHLIHYQIPAAMLEILPKLTSFELDLSEAVAISFDKQNFSYARAQKWMVEQRPFALQVSILYVVLVFTLKKWMEDREAFKLNGPLKLWNAFIGGVSIFCAVGMTRDFWGTLFNKGVTASVCSSGLDLYMGDTGFYVWIYHMIRIFEFGDTAFIILRKQPLIFLHWYHHALTLFYGWYAYPEMNTHMRMPIYINSVVHGFMYTYYLLRAMKVPVPGIFAQSITAFQIFQFLCIIAALVHTTIATYIMKVPCESSLDVMIFGWVVNGSYLVLFTLFYMNKYNKKEKTEKTKKAE
ncbi:hypothetical protein PMAYCL1PPCAC_32890, partial [Pristionchus mayeri]